jgi:hypothetical protein
MAKKILMTLIVLSLATAAFAAGQKEDSQQYGPYQGDKLVLKGTVSLQYFPPVLKSGDKQYVLMVPPYLVNRSGVKDGAQVTVQGYQMRSSPFSTATGDKTLIRFVVTQATIDGKDYDLSRYHGGMMGGGPGYGMMGRGDGPGYGYGGGMMGGRGPYGRGDGDDDQF